MVRKKNAKLKKFAVLVSVEVTDYDEQYVIVEASSAAQAKKLVNVDSALETLSKHSYYDGHLTVSIQDAEPYNEELHGVGVDLEA
jgi:hypothetical protein